MEILGHRFQFLKDKAIYWETAETLILSDVHLGKAEFFQSRGVPVPSEAHDEDLNRIRELVTSFNAKRVILLGDVFHTNQYHENLEKKFSACLKELKVQWIFISGNHDKKKLHELMKAHPEWIDQYDVLMEEPFVFIHEHDPEGARPRPDRFYFSGHIHPVVHLAGNQYSLRLPCFWKRQNSVVLPSFGTLTGGYVITPAEEDEIYAITDRSVIQL